MFDGSGFASVGTVNAEVFDFTFLLLIKSVEEIIKAMAVLTSLHLQCLTCCSIQADGQKALAAAKELFVYQYTPHSNGKLCVLPTVLTTTQGTTYLNVKFRALPNRTEYPGVTEKGLQVTRVYEIKDAAGNWKPATEFRVGDVVRVTLTCAKAAPELEYFVLEDYLPACMEAINPNVPSQAAGLELTWRAWSPWFDHKEYLADRVRGFCTRWGGRDLLNMSYYARVKRAGTSTAPPAEAQLMYEPQTYGLSPNTTIISH